MKKARGQLSIQMQLNIQPFDVVLLDHKMPKISGINVAKKILAVNPRQRIVFSSGYVKKTLLDSIRELNQPLGVFSKPFGTQTLIDAIEDKEIYAGLQTTFKHGLY